jgi:hypothetical protein
LASSAGTGGRPRLTDSDKEILRRITMGDPADEFADSLAAGFRGGSLFVETAILPEAVRHESSV